MSLWKFLSHLWDAIKNLFEGLEPKLKDAIHIGVVVTDKIKTFVESGDADILTSIIPGDWDEELKQKLRSALPDILINLKLADKCAQLTDTNEIIKCAIETLQSIEGDFKSAFLHDLSILIAQVAADGKLDWKDGVVILQWYYDNKYKNEQP